MFIPIHSKVSVDDLLHGVIIQSANDACIVLAEGLAGNEILVRGDDDQAGARARSHQIDLRQLERSARSAPAHDGARARQARAAHHRYLSGLLQIYGEREFTWNKIRQQNRNPLLTLTTGADGLKTGFTKEAGYGLVGSAVQNGMRLIVVVNGLKSEKERADEAKKLLEWGFPQFPIEPALRRWPGDRLGQGLWRRQGSVPLMAAKEVRLMVPRSTREKIIARVVYNGPVPAPVQQGQKVGTLKVWRGDFVALEVPLQAADSVEVGSMPRRAFDAASELVIGLFRAGFQRALGNGAGT